jgi:hypothetical protein
MAAMMANPFAHHMGSSFELRRYSWGTGLVPRPQAIRKHTRDAQNLSISQLLKRLGLWHFSKFRVLIIFCDIEISTNVDREKGWFWTVNRDVEIADLRCAEISQNLNHCFIEGGQKKTADLGEIFNNPYTVFPPRLEHEIPSPTDPLRV